MATQVEFLDVVVFISVVLMSIMIGVYFANRNKTMSDYMLGAKSMGVLPVAMSMMTSFVSGVTMVSAPYEVFSQGWFYGLMALGSLVASPITVFLIVPVFYEGNYLSIYEYLEERFNKKVRLFVSVLFILQMLLYNAMVIYVPSLALQATTGMDKEYLILGVGAACAIYCTLGGIKAVIWTDLLQGSMMIVSLLVVCIAGTYRSPGGFMDIWSAAKEGGRLDIDDMFNFDLSTRTTLYNILTGCVILNIYMNATNQIQVQRTFCLPTLRKAQIALLLSTLVTMAIYLLCGYTGLIVYYKYRDCNPVTTGEIQKGDAILPLYIVRELSNIPGLCGLFIAGIVSATLSTLSSFANSLAAITLDDFIRPLSGKQIGDRSATLICKFLAFFYCVLCVAISFAVDYVERLLETALTLFATIGSPFLAAFVVGMHVKFCNTIGVVTGIAFSVIFGFLFQIAQQIYATPPINLPTSTTGCIPEFYNQTHGDVPDFVAPSSKSIFDVSYLWVPAISLVVTLTIMCVVSLMTGGRKQRVNEKCLFSTYKNNKKKSIENGQDIFQW